jgi:hypothetical protein
MKKEFILKEIWLSTVSAAFQRANVYKANCIEPEKIIFKNALKSFISNISESYQTTSVTEKQHVKNIYSVSEYSKKFRGILNNGQLNLGISQKLLNLYLKYLWCLDYITVTPPHFPVDRIIQTKLKIVYPYPWTQMLDEVEYLKIIRKAEDALKTHKKDSLAELELFLYERNRG